MQCSINENSHRSELEGRDTTGAKKAKAKKFMGENYLL
jgi:hypothetical protein